MYVNHSTKPTFFQPFNGLACQNKFDSALTNTSQSRIFRTLRLLVYIHENEKFRETVFVCSYADQVESFKQKKMQKSRDTATFRPRCRKATQNIAKMQSDNFLNMVTMSRHCCRVPSSVAPLYSIKPDLEPIPYHVNFPFQLFPALRRINLCC